MVRLIDLHIQSEPKLIFSFNSRDGAIDSRERYFHNRLVLSVSIPEMVRLIAGLTGAYSVAMFGFNSRDGAIDSPAPCIAVSQSVRFQFQRWCD